MPSHFRTFVIGSLTALLVIGAGCRGADAPQAPVVTLAAVGDVLLARGVGQKIAEFGPDYPFEKTSEIISGADIAFFNLECALSKRGLPHSTKFAFRADPALAEAPASAGFEVASLANNHTLDFGRDAILDTIQAIERAGMLPIGAGRNRDDALSVRVIERKGIRIGFIGYTDLANAGVVRLDDRPTVAGVNSDELPDQIKAAKEKCDALVVSFHWGIEYMKTPTERQQELARLAIDSGADLILGHHPHVLQTVEVYKERPIVYSMGAFVWDGNRADTRQSAIYLFELGKSSARLVRTIPIKIVKCRPVGT